MGGAKRWGGMKHGREEEADGADADVYGTLPECRKFGSAVRCHIPYSTVDFRMNWMDRFGSRLN